MSIHEWQREDERMSDLIDYYRRGGTCRDYNATCRDRSSGCPCTETAEALEAQQAVIDAAQNVVNTYINKPFCDAASPLEIEDVLKLAEALAKLSK